MAKFCAECGASLKEDATFCSACGAKVPADKKPEPDAETQILSQPQTTSGEQTQTPPKQTYQQQTYQTTYQPSQPYFAPTYTQPAVQPVSTAYYFWMMLLFAIPVVGLIVCLVTAFSGDDTSRKNFSRAVLIWILVAIVLSIIVAIAIAALGGSFMNIMFNSYRYY